MTLPQSLKFDLGFAVRLGSHLLCAAILCARPAMRARALLIWFGLQLGAYPTLAAGAPNLGNHRNQTQLLLALEEDEVRRRDRVRELAERTTWNNGRPEPPAF